MDIDKTEKKKLYMREYYKKYYLEHKKQSSTNTQRGRPKKYTPEEAHEKIKESKRKYAKKMRETRSTVFGDQKLTDITDDHESETN